MLSPTTHPGRPRSGASAVELACILPVVIALALGTVDLGRVAHYENVLSNAARVGADHGATHRLYSFNRTQWESRIIARVQEEAAHLPQFDAARLQVVVETFTQADGTLRVEVEAAYPFEMIVDWPGLPHDIDLRCRVAEQEYR
jgi:Flp pilus assembly protein TadG